MQKKVEADAKHRAELKNLKFSIKSQAILIPKHPYKIYNDILGFPLGVWINFDPFVWHNAIFPSL